MQVIYDFLKDVGICTIFVAAIGIILYLAYEVFDARQEK